MAGASTVLVDVKIMPKYINTKLHVQLVMRLYSKPLLKFCILRAVNFFVTNHVRPAGETKYFQDLNTGIIRMGRRPIGPSWVI